MTEKKFIPSLTGIRAICAYVVFFYHVNFFSPLSNPKMFLLLNQFQPILAFFFVLSGFVICLKNYEIRDLEKNKLYNYFVNRASKVFPILIILISLTFLLEYIHFHKHPELGYYNAKESLKLYFLNITLLKGFSSQYYLTGIAPSWSMTVEELFYILTPFIFLYVKNVSSLLKFVLIFYTAGFLLTLFFMAHPTQGYFGDYLFTAYNTFFGRVFEFACGIYLAMVVSGKLENQTLKKIGRNTLYIGLIIVFSSFGLLFYIAQKNNIIHGIRSWPGVAVNNLLMPIGIIFLFYSLVYYKSALQSFLASKIMIQLGNSTYSFYLLHTSFMLSLIYKYISTNVFIAFIVMIIISFIFHKTVEQPLAVFFRRKLLRKPITQ